MAVFQEFFNGLWDPAAARFLFPSVEGFYGSRRTVDLARLLRSFPNFFTGTLRHDVILLRSIIQTRLRNAPLLQTAPELVLSRQWPRSETLPTFRKTESA